MHRTDFAAAFEEPEKSPERAGEYARDLRENWKAADAAASRAMLLILILAATFLLIGDQGIGDVSLAGITITNLGYVQAGIPVITAYLYQNVTTNVAMSFRLGEIHDGLCAHYWPGFYKEDLERTLRPAGSLGSTTLLVHTTDWGKIGNFLVAPDYARFLVFLSGPPVFVAYALIVVWQQTQLPTAAAVVVTALSTLLVVSSAPNIWLIARR